MTVFLGCGFAAKYPQGGGNFSVPLQWMLGLRRLGLDAVWLELLPTCGNPAEDVRRVRHFQRLLQQYGLGGRYCVLRQDPASDAHDLGGMRCHGMSRRELLERLAGPSTLLNLSYSIHPPLLLEFERRILCDIDPSEIFFWMTKVEMGQSSHHEFCTIGLNVGQPDCRLPETSLPWRTFFPLVDTEFIRAWPAPRRFKFTTIGQWYWGGGVEVDGEFPDLSKKFAFEKYMELPRRVPAAQFELAMNLNEDDPEIARLNAAGWRVVSPHRLARTPAAYYRYIQGAAAEFTAIKGVDVAWKTGWISDRAAAFLASGRSVITEDTGAAHYLPERSGMHFVHDAASAADAADAVMANWDNESRAARAAAVEVFDAPKNLRKILQI